MNNVSEPTQDQYIECLEDDLKAARAVIAAVSDLFITATMDEDCLVYCVDAARFNEIQDAIELLRTA